MTKNEKLKKQKIEILGDDKVCNDLIQHDVDGNYNKDMKYQAIIELGLNVTSVFSSMRQELSVSGELCVIIVAHHRHYNALRRVEFSNKLV